MADNTADDALLARLDDAINREIANLPLKANSLTIYALEDARAYIHALRADVAILTGERARVEGEDEAVVFRREPNNHMGEGDA